MFIRRLRLITGLILATYVLLHLLNLALGLLSLDAMEAARRVHHAVWTGPVGAATLLTALLTHFFLALWALFRRSTLRMPAWEATQLWLGLLIPPLLALHAAGTMGMFMAVGQVVSYRDVILFYWADPWGMARQLSGLVVAWLHMCVGLHFWLRLYPWYGRTAPALLVVASLVPVLALVGFNQAGQTYSRQAAAQAPDSYGDYDFGDGAGKQAAPAGNEAGPTAETMTRTVLWTYAGLLAAVLLARWLRRLYRNRRGRFRIHLPDRRPVTAPVGITLLDALRQAGIPHASVCGGRGRCSTCRVRVDADGLHALTPPRAIERTALDRIGAPANVRLACQIRPRRDLAATPLLPVDATVAMGRRRGGVDGSEQPVAVMFVDLRESTKMAETYMAYDTVFILNRFFTEITQALEETGGHYAQFTGDGLMALYGLDLGFETGCRQAVTGAVRMCERLEELNGQLRGELGVTLRIGIGIHAGEAIVGTMGPPASPLLSAVGDNVNVAARLEALTKEFGCPLVVSAAAAAAAGLDMAAFPRHDAEIRGRVETIPVHAVTDPAAIPL
ncbi:MAG: adenylate/guanylate cyclase domain-containing protein [Hyphomicrobiales bacterium]|nr:adenylate/guanylate cyclase domain-containing protein [Hyphomicrobiales bacterium]MCP5372533.1 adenylate/guanylate cyclase domain-containing protein [Hyphomicrobiales bacterium]